MARGKAQKQRKELPKGTRSGVALTDLEKEAVRQTYALTNNYRETARIHRLGERTVHNVIKKHTDPEELKELRVETFQRMAKRTHDKAREVIDKIADKDIDDASLMQKTTAFAILTDKTIALDKHIMERQRQLLEQEGDKPIAPVGLENLVNGIMREVGSLQIFAAHIQRPTQLDDIEQEAQMLQAEATRAALSEPMGVTSIADFDDAGESAEPGESKPNA